MPVLLEYNKLLKPSKYILPEHKNKQKNLIPVFLNCSIYLRKQRINAKHPKALNGPAI